MAKYKYNVFTGELDLVDGTGGGTNPVSPLFSADIPVVLAGGKNFGKYTNGDTIPAAGKTAEQKEKTFLPSAVTAQVERSAVEDDDACVESSST